MNEFASALRAQADQARKALEQARQAGDDDEMHEYGARLLDLLECAGTHGIDTTGWVPPTALSLASAAAGNSS